MSKNRDPLFEELKTVAADLCNNEKRIGEILLEAESTPGKSMYYMEWLSEHAQIPIARSKCLIRWAKGELGTDQEALLLIHGGVPASVVSKMPTETVKRVLTERHVIEADPDAPHRYPEKSFQEMTPDERRRNVTTKGIQPLDTPVVGNPDIRGSRCGSIKLAEKPGYVRCFSAGRDHWYMELSLAQVQQAAALLESQSQQKSTGKGRKRRTA